jgi:hypothetical protein
MGILESITAAERHHERAMEILYRLRRRAYRTADLRSELRNPTGAAHRESVKRKLSMSEAMGKILLQGYHLTMTKLEA